jgi:membrane-associated phospholipid phosphatase
MITFLRSVLQSLSKDSMEMSMTLQRRRNALFDLVARFVNWTAGETAISIIFAVFYCVLSTTLSEELMLMWALGCWLCCVLREIFRVARPTLPVVAVESSSHSTSDYSFPSLHTWSVTGVALFVVLSLEEYVANFRLLLVLSLTWVALVALMRVYMGADSAVDVVGGIFLSLVFGVFYLLAEDSLFDASKRYSFVLAVILCIVAVYVFPRRKTSNRSYRDACVPLAVASGVLVGTVLDESVGLLMSERERGGCGVHSLTNLIIDMNR